MLHISQMTKISQMSLMVVRGCARACMGVRGCGRVCVGVRGCARVSVGECGCVRVCVWDEFSEYLLETRFLTSANYNPHPLRIFYNIFLSGSISKLGTI